MLTTIDEDVDLEIAALHNLCRLFQIGGIGEYDNSEYMGKCIITTPRIISVDPRPEFTLWTAQTIKRIIEQRLGAPHADIKVKRIWDGSESSDKNISMSAESFLEIFSKIMIIDKTIMNRMVKIMNMNMEYTDWVKSQEQQNQDLVGEYREMVERDNGMMLSGLQAHRGAMKSHQRWMRFVCRNHYPVHLLDMSYERLVKAKIILSRLLVRLERCESISSQYRLGSDQQMTITSKLFGLHHRHHLLQKHFHILKSIYETL
uniref:Uncharacterized protein n=1 Tax=Spongospora subterranea TaxID=70186 RepID=A0A0H5R9P9_9EUKA|eukprot:CRZ10808.1 hypothetical protein [Spongospora subterranea]